LSPVEDQQRKPLASALRSALFRGALFAIVLFIALLAFIGATYLIGNPPGGSPAGWIFVELAVTSVVLGVTATPLAFAEAYVAWRSRSRAGDWFGGALTGALAFVLVVIGSVQIAYTDAILRTGSFSNAADAVKSFVSTGILREFELFFPLFGLVAVPFVPVTVGRVRSLPLGRLVLGTVGWSTVLALPLYLLLFAQSRSADVSILVLFGCALLATYAALPLVLAGADAIERRVGVWLEKESS
jgi:hypothetical protein